MSELQPIPQCWALRWFLDYIAYPSALVWCVVLTLLELPSILYEELKQSR